MKLIETVPDPLLVSLVEIDVGGATLRLNWDDGDDVDDVDVVEILTLNVYKPPGIREVVLTIDPFELVDEIKL